MGEHEKAAGQGICLGGGGVRVRSEQPGARRGPSWGWKNVLGDQCVVLRTAVPLTLAAGGCVSLAIHKIIVSSNLRNQKPFGGHRAWTLSAPSQGQSSFLSPAMSVQIALSCLGDNGRRWQGILEENMCL